MSEHTPMPIPDGRVEVGGKTYMPDTKGNLVPVELIAPATQLEDETVRKIMSYAVDLSARVARFKGHTFEDLGALEALLGQEYGVTKGGAKGNKTFMSHDGLFKVQVQVADHIDFGPQLQIAKELIDECLNEWAADITGARRLVADGDTDGHADRFWAGALAVSAARSTYQPYEYRPVPRGGGRDDDDMRRIRLTSGLGGMKGVF